MENELWIDEQGNVQFIYADDLALMFAGEGDATTRRASHVEPFRSGWLADMTPVADDPANAVLVAANGTWFKHCPGVLDLVEPFATRAAALAAEVAWLRAHMAEGGL